MTLPIQYPSKPVGTWNSPVTFNRISQEEAIYRTWTWLDLYEICYLYDFYLVRIMFSRCKDILQNIVLSLKFLWPFDFFGLNKPIPLTIILTNNEDGELYSNSSRIKVVNYCCKTLHLRCLWGSWLHLWLLTWTILKIFYCDIFPFHLTTFISINQK